MNPLKEAIRPYYLRWLYFRLRPSRRPDSFRDCWRYPYQKLTAGNARIPESDSRLPCLLFYPMNDWHTRIQRTQHLVQAFASRGFRCIYLNPHLGREFPAVPLFDKAHRLSRLEENIFELHVRLPREPVFHHRLLTADEEAIIASAIETVLPQGAAAIQISSFPLWLGVARRFRQESGFPIVYDCHDLLPAFSNVSADLVAAEAGLLREADLAIFSSEALLERHGTFARKSLLVRNAVNAAAFEDAVARMPGVPAIGYVGALDSWFDIEAVRQAALENPGCRFVLAGRIESQAIGQLGLLPNVQLLGETPYHRVPELLAEFAVGLIPFILTPLTLMTNPIKLYEYFSRGLPVVSSPLPEAAAMGDLVYIAHNPSEFARKVKQALEEDDPTRRGRRREIAARESWSARADQISAEFSTLLRVSDLPKTCRK